LLDKTGTVTLGKAKVDEVVALDGVDQQELLRLAASLDQLSAHALAEALVHDAARRDIPLTFPEHVEEQLGQGIEGTVDGRRIAVGSASWLVERGYEGDPLRIASDLDRHEGAGRAKVLIGMNGRVVGGIVMGDHLRDDAPKLITELRGAGIGYVAIVTGDRAGVAEEIGDQLGVDRVYADCSPEEKLDVVRALQRSDQLAPVLMVGDGINDAPALALADVGIAMGAAGATAASQTADAVIVLDRVDRVADAVRIGRRSLHIARQSVLFGMALSGVAMVFAAFGFIVPVVGALLQEGIDVAVILNALRALRG
jgi:P-type E1-E2 ATPase